MLNKKSIKIVTLVTVFLLGTNWANANLKAKIKYSSNYLMPAYVSFDVRDNAYSLEANINIPLYKIKFITNGMQERGQFMLLDYQDMRNGKLYASTRIAGNEIEYGKVKSGLKKEKMTTPVFDLFSVALQLSYYEKLPDSFQITNGKKLYPMKDVKVSKSEKTVSYQKRSVTEITYQFQTGAKAFVVKKYAGESFPRYISYDKDGDHYELTFSGFVKE